MTHPDIQPQTPLRPEFESDELWREYLGPMAVAVAELAESVGPEDHIHQVGTLDLDYLGSRPAFLLGLGEGHTALRGDEANVDQSVRTAQSLVLQMLESVPAGTVRLRVFNGYQGKHTGAFADFAKGLGPTLFEQAK